MKVLLLLLVAAGSLGIARAGEVDTAMRLLKAMNYEETSLSAGRAMFEPFLNQMRSEGQDEETLEKIRKAADDFMLSITVDAKLQRQVAELYAAEFSEPELEELIGFYDTPIGKKLLAVQPSLMAEAAKLGEAAAQKRMPDFQAKLMEILEGAEAGHGAGHDEDNGEAAPDADE